MTLLTLEHSLILLGVCISILGYVFGSVLENQKVRTLLEDLWVALALQVESPMLLRARTLEITTNIFGALYHRNGKFSHLKLFAITVIFVLSGFIGAVVDANDGRIHEVISILFSRVIDFLGAVFLALMGSYFYEYGAYRISLYFLGKAGQQNNRIYLGINLAVIFLLVYVFPTLPIFMIWFVAAITGMDLLDLISIHDPLMAVMVVVSASAAAPALLMLSSSGVGQILLLPAALSFCFPAALLLASIAVLHNRWALSVMVKSLERISAVNARRIKNSSLSLLAFVLGAIEIIGYFRPK